MWQRLSQNNSIIYLKKNISLFSTTTVWVSRLDSTHCSGNSLQLHNTLLNFAIKKSARKFICFPEIWVTSLIFSVCLQISVEDGDVSSMCEPWNYFFLWKKQTNKQTIKPFKVVIINSVYREFFMEVRVFISDGLWWNNSLFIMHFVWVLGWF